jgi:hypothetical protein
MDHAVVCGWLGLGCKDWPPDHYTLLGLAPGEEDPARIEQKVHERLASLRCYQISHPEQATEAMNFLAQAFMCLTDPEAKKHYDASLGRTKGSSVAKAPTAGKKGQAITTLVVPLPGRGPASPPRPASLNDTAVGTAVVTQVDWKGTVAPPPVRNPQGSTGSVSAVASTAGASEPSEVPAAPASPGEAVVPASEEHVPEPVPAREQPETAPLGPLAGYRGFSPAILAELTSRRGLGEIVRIFKRVRQTRRLLYAWNRAGKYLSKSRRLLKNRDEVKELSRALHAISRSLKGFPLMLGQPGHPGYRVAARARMPLDPDAFNTLSVEQRELLALDWAAGQMLLSSHRQFLRQELRTVRGLGRWRLMQRAVVNDYAVPAVLAVVVALVLVSALLAILW